jgi:long-chain acyl-CoA synthetase
MHTPWLEHYDAGVPKSIGDYPHKTLVDFVRDRAAATPDATALVFKGRKVSYGEIERDSDALAHSLKELGVKPGERVALVLPNAPQFVIAELAAWKLGAMIAPQNPIYTEREIEESLRATAPETIIVLTPFYERIKRVQANTSVKRVIATNIKEYLPGLLRVLFTLAKEKKEGHRIELQKGDWWLQSLIDEGSPAGKFASAADPDEPAVVLMSGGTTGTPKGVVSEHYKLVMAGLQLTAWLKDALQGPNASIMLPLPLFHTYGCAGAQVLAFISGIPLILVPNPRDVDDLVKTIQRDKPALLCGVPTLFNALLNHKEVLAGKVDFRSIRACFSGASALMAETKKRFEELTGGRIVEGYSLTEATMAVFANPLAGANKTGSVGMPLSDVMVRIVDSDDAAKEMPTGEVGEILIHARQLMRGYWDNPSETAEMLRIGADGKQWLFTGDLGYLDADGYLFIVDRKKDLIKTSGFQVWPREIEEVIASHPAVAEVGVAGVPDVRKSEVITAWVVARPGESIDPEVLRTWCREKLAPYKVPAKIEIRTELPKTMVGKVLRRALVAEAKEKQAAG